MNNAHLDGSNEQRRTPAWWRVMSVIIVALVFGVLMRATLLMAAPLASPAGANLAQNPLDDGGGDDDDDNDDDYEVQYGIIISRSEEFPGTLVISKTAATTYTVTGETELDGDLSIGACVEVKSADENPTEALKIRAKEAEYCTGHDDDDDDSDDGDFVRSYGIVMTRPVESIGTWVISGTTYTVTEKTVLEGDLVVGACVEVKALKSDPYVLYKIEAKEAYQCLGSDDDDDDDDDGGHDDDDKNDIERYGRLESRPAGKVGVWIIGGTAYSATESTELDEEHGQLIVGVCTKVHVLVENPTVAREIESEKDYKCNGREDDDDDDARGLLFGVIEGLPADLENGIWKIGGLSFVVSPTTEIISKGSEITVGLTVKVNFTTNTSDTNYADRIEVKFGQGSPCRRHNDLFLGLDHNGDDDDDDDRDYGYCPGHEGKTFGLIDSRPDGSLIGEWMIGGVPYITTASTKFEADDDFLTGERVKVEYVVLSDNMRRITKMKESDDNGGVSNPNHSLIVGYVDAKPDAFVGAWTINGAPFQAMSTTVFIERGSLFAVGAYVVVEYEIVNDQRVIIKILTYVPPGAGDDNKVGKLESVGGLSVTGTTPLQSVELWTVDGVDYVVNAATQVVEGDTELAPGAVVYVNSYTADGQRYATMIRTQGGKAFIPMAAR